MDMLKDWSHRDYKSNKSTIDVIYNIKRDIIKKQSNGQILLYLSKASDRIDRGELWNILYQKGLPINLTSQLKRDAQKTCYAVNKVGNIAKKWKRYKVTPWKPAQCQSLHNIHWLRHGKYNDQVKPQTLK